MARYTMKTPAVALFPYLLKPDNYNDKSEYKVTLLLDKNDPEQNAEANRLTELYFAAIKEGITGHRADGSEIKDKNNNIKAPFVGHDFDDKKWRDTVYSPIEDGDTAKNIMGPNKDQLKNIQHPEYKGHWVVTIKTRADFYDPARTIGMDRRPLTEEYSGMLVRVNINAFPHRGKDAMHVGFAPLAVVKTGDGERLRSSGYNPLDAFGLPPMSDDPLADMGV